MPQRAFADKRLRTRHFRVLGAVARAIDIETGISLISQDSIARWAGLARQNVGRPLVDLENWGYLAKIRRGRTTRGKYRTLAYQVKYKPSAGVPSIDGGDMAHVMPGDDKPVSPPGVADSDKSKPDLQGESECRQSTDEVATTGPVTSSLQSNVNKKPNGCHLGKQSPKYLSSTDPMTRSEQSEMNRMIRVLAKAKANLWESELRKQAEERLCDAISKTFPGDAFAPAIGAIAPDTYERAVNIEIRDKGRGSIFLIKSIRRTLKHLT